MVRAFLLLLAGVGVAAGAIDAAQQHEDGEKVNVLSTIELVEELDEQAATATVVEVTIEPGQDGLPHRHPGSAIGYVLEGEYEVGIDDQPTKVIKAGETFSEPKRCLHRVSRNPGKVRTRLIAVVIHPREAKEIAVPASAATCAPGLAPQNP